MAARIAREVPYGITVISDAEKLWLLGKTDFAPRHTPEIRDLIQEWLRLQAKLRGDPTLKEILIAHGFGKSVRVCSCPDAIVCRLEIPRSYSAASGSGSTRPGSVFLTFPTWGDTGHEIILSDANGWQIACRSSAVAPVSLNHTDHASCARMTGIRL